MKKLLAIIPIAFLLTLVGVMAADPTATMVTPATSATVIGTITLNATVSAELDFLNCSFEAMSANTANSSWSRIAVATNGTNDATYFNTTFNTRLGALEDGLDYTFRARCSNATYLTAYATATTGITVDNTIPQAATSLSPADGSTDNDGDVDFSGTVIDTNTTGCGLTLGVKGYTTTYSTSSCTATVNDIPEGVYEWYITAIDGTNETTSARQTLSIDYLRHGITPDMQEALTKEKDTKSKQSMTYVVALIIIIVILYWVFKRK